MSDLPTPALEDWRYVDCRPLAAAAAAGATVPPGADGGAPPAAADAAHAWAAAGAVRSLRLAGDGALELDDRGGAWTWLIEVAPGATQRLRVRRHRAEGRSASWIHARVGRGASLEIEDSTLAEDDVRLAAIGASVAQDARLAVRVAQRGGRLSRHRVDVALEGRGAHVELRAAAAPRGEGQAHLLSRVTHAGGTTSDQLVKAVLRDRSRASFDGLVSMPPGADGASAVQQDRNLLLSPQARADTRPQLDIRADEVEASHGATVGALDGDELLYLRARGLPLPQAREALTAAFLDEALLSFADPAIREAMHGV